MESFLKNSDLKNYFINFLVTLPWLEEVLIFLPYATWTSRLLDRLHVLTEGWDDSN